jgi:hypothetical protein
VSTSGDLITTLHSWKARCVFLSLFLVGLGFELSGRGLQGRHSTTWATPPVLYLSYRSLDMKLLSTVVNMYLILLNKTTQNLLNCFPEWLYCVIFIPEEHENPVATCVHQLWVLNVFLIFSIPLGIQWHCDMIFIWHLLPESQFPELSANSHESKVLKKGK